MISWLRKILTASLFLTSFFLLLKSSEARNPVISAVIILFSLEIFLLGIKVWKQDSSSNQG